MSKTKAERFYEYCEDFAVRHGWSEQSGEGLFEFISRTHYRCGFDDGIGHKKNKRITVVNSVSYKEGIHQLSKFVDKLGFPKKGAI